MTNATARAAARKPPSTDLPDGLPPGVRESIAHVACDPAPGNDHEVGDPGPFFFRRLRQQRPGIGSNGADWARARGLDQCSAWLLAEVDCSLYALGGLLTVLSAGEHARSADCDDLVLGDRVTDQLQHAASVLTGHALDSICRFRERVGVDQ